MRKTLLALILVIPMVFVIVIFSSVNIISLGVNISVSGIEIKLEGPDDGDGDENILSLDMAKKLEYTVAAEVLPSNATEKGYTLASSDPEVVEVTKGKIVPLKEGSAEIVATSNDKGFTDSLSVVVVSSKPYGFDFTLFDGAGKPVVLEEAGDILTAAVPTGSYTYDMSIHPMEFTQYTIEQTEETAEIYTEIERGAKSIFLPFTGRVELSLFVKDGVDGDIRKMVILNVTKPEDAVALVNGKAAFEDPASRESAVFGDETDGSMLLVEGTASTELFVECSGGYPQFSSDDAECKSIKGKNGRYTLDISFREGVKEAEATITAGGHNIFYLFSFTEEFTFSVFSDREISEAEGGGREVTILTGTNASFYAVAAGGAKGVLYSWKLEGREDLLTADGNTATIKAAEEGSFVLVVTATYGAKTQTQTIAVNIIKKVSVIQIANNVKVDLARDYTVAGKAYNASLGLVDNTYPLLVYTYSSTSGLEQAGGEVEYDVTGGGKIAEIDRSSGKPVLIPKGTGAVTVTARWVGNAAFKANVQGTLSLNIVFDAVAVGNAPELVDAAEKGREIVLTQNIKLGTDASGADLSIEQRLAVLKKQRMRSTYNIEWYRYTQEALTDESSKISYALEFRNSVYGNGKSIDAGNYTHAHDANGTPLLDLYKGPLYFVNYRQMASVAGQDNCAFLIRTDGVKLYGVNLLGCDDSLLADPETGEYDLTRLNLTGTTLEVNADCEIVNCRVRNGRNVVRAYGGNRDGSGYFLERLPGTEIADADRINVTIEGCILSQGREFILKMGANRALRASSVNGQEPQLRDSNNAPYPEQKSSNVYSDGALYRDEWFYSHYVMTDVVLKDSVIETSGLFTVGIESNFSGEFLYEGAPDHQWRAFTKEWEHSGGTSFASVLRLEGDVRLYDWKDSSLIDSSSLIESPIGALHEWLKLDLKGMIDFVTKKEPSYAALIEDVDGKQFVHGGIALYGGGRNYSAVDLSGLTEGLNDLLHVNINISVLADAGGNMTQQGTVLPRAAGSHDFNFYMYGSSGGNNYLKQLNDEQRGLKYKGVTSVALFD